MFYDIGGKIKALATTITVIGMIASAIYGFYMIEAVNALTGIVIIIVGFLIAWLSSFTLYALGEIVDLLVSIHQRIYRIEGLLGKTYSEKSAPGFETPNPPTRQFADWTCDKCGRQNEATAQFCKDCGKYR